MIGIHDFCEDSGIQVFKRGNPERKRKILELFRKGNSKSDIARSLGITKQAVAETITKAKKEEQAAEAGEEKPWYQRIADDKLELCNAAAGKENPEWSTKLAETVKVRDITEYELMMHTYPHTLSGIEPEDEKTNKIKAGRRWLQERLTDSPPGKNHHGFVIFPAPHYTVSDCTVVNKQLPGLLDKPDYQKVFTSIFQTVQGKDGNTSYGDNKRKQAKLLELAQMGKQRHKEAEGIFYRFLDRTVSKRKTEALETMREIAAEGALVNEVVDHMLALYSGIAQVWPSQRKMPETVGEMELLAVLESLPGAEDQSFHCDSKKPGASGITSFEKDQFVYVLFFAFHAMRILEDLRNDRLSATDYIRTSLAERQISFSDDQWERVAEPRIWQFLVHEEFRARGVSSFEVVAVPVRKDQTIVLDTRCVHAGAPWPSEERAYRGHFYGYERDIQKQTQQERLEKDEYHTVDLCDEDYLPIVGWAQLNEIFKLKADLPQPQRRSRPVATAAALV